MTRSCLASGKKQAPICLAQMVLPSPSPGSEPRQHCPLEHSVMIDYFSFYNFLYFLKHAYIILTERGEKSMAVIR